MFKLIAILWYMLALSGQASSSVCPKIKFSEGRMVSTDDISGCIFSIGSSEGRKLHGTEISSFSIYGVVHFNCGVCESTEISLYSECKDCSFCLHNEHIKGCRAVVVPTMIAIGITLIIAIILILLAWCTDIPNVVAKHLALMSIYRAERRIHKRKNAARKLIETGLLQPVNPYQNQNQIHAHSSHVHSPLVEDKPQVPARPVNYPNIYMELKALQDPPSHQSESNPSGTTTASAPSEEYVRPGKKPIVATFNKTAVVAGLIPALMLGRVDCCDITAYVSSSNVIYRDSGMTEVYSGIFLASTGQSVCLKYSDDTIDRITVGATWLEDIYSPLYRTSNYELTTETKWNCMGSGYCWDGYCQKSSIHPDWVKSVKNGSITTFGCFQSASYCSHCTYNKQCVYYKATIKPKGTIYTVYKITETNWKAKIQITHHDGSIEFLTISNQIITGGTSVKVGLTAPSFSKFKYHDSLISNPEGITWNVHASELGDLSQAMIGDLQIGLYDDSQLAYLTTSMDCQPNSCSTQCELPESGLIRGIKQYRNYTVDTIEFGSDKIVQRKTRMSFSMFITTDKSFGINVIEADCQFTLLATYGCTACSKPSIAYIQTKELKNNGLVKFTSNCSLETNTLSCQESVQQIKISGHQENCEIKVNNQTLILSVDYIFEGEVYDLGVVIATGKDSTTSQVMSAFLSNPSFITGISSMLSITFIIGFAAAIIKSILRYSTVYAGIKAGKEVNSAI